MELPLYIERVSPLCSAKIKQFEANLHSLQEKTRRCGDSGERIGSTETLKQVLDVWLTFTDECIASFQDVMSAITPNISWHKKNDMLEMFYLSGDNPWSFWLTYNMPDVECVLKEIEKRWRSGLLCKVEKPEGETFVCSCDQKSCFRGYIISVLSKTWVRILNVDKGHVKLAKVDSCYELPKELCEPHANAIHCSLLKDEFKESKWNPDLIELFQTTLRESRLTVRILEKMDTNPPKFLIELYAFNESSEVETSISHWVSSRLLPVLEALDSGANKESLYDYLDDDALDPFCISGLGINNSFSDSEANEILSFKGSANEVAEKPLEATYDCPISCKEKPRNRLAEIMNTEKEKSFHKSKEEEINGSIVKKEVLPTNTFLFENAVNAPEFKPNGKYPSSPEPHAHLHSPPKTEAIHSNSPAREALPEDPSAYNHFSLHEAQGICPSFASNGFCWKPNCQKEHIVMTVSVNDESIGCGDYERPAIPGAYKPTDDQRTCAFYLSKGYCWKTGCQKEHIKPAIDKWTDDSAEVYKESFNKLCLPSIGTKCTVSVTHVMAPTSFYLTLPRAFSDSDDGESIESLNRNLNDPSVCNVLKILSSPPCFGQLIVAFSATKKQWLRASVYDVYDNDIILVFFVDYGITEEVKSDKCREILPQHIHLPYQAVYCSLSGVYIEESQEEAGKNFLEQLILDKEIKVEIKDSDIHDTRIEVVAFTSTGLNLNETMIKRGFCSRFQH